MADDDDLPDDDSPENEAIAAYEHERDGLHQTITEYLDDSEIGPGLAVPMLIEIMISLRLETYGFGVENPSVSGLKLDLDRLGRDFADALRETKKDAEALLDEIKQTRADMDAAAEAVGAEEGEGADGEDEKDEETSH